MPDLPPQVSLNPAARRAIVFSLPWLVLLLGLLLLQVWFPNVDAARQNDTYNVDVGGRNALFQFVQRRCGTVSRNTRPLLQLTTTLPNNASLCILGPARYPTDAEWASLLSWVNRGGQLIIASRWHDPQMSVGNLGVTVNQVGELPTNVFNPFGGQGANSKPQKSPNSPPLVTPPPVNDNAPPVVPPTAPPKPADPLEQGEQNVGVGAMARPKNAVSEQPLIPMVGIDWRSNARISAVFADLLLGNSGSQQAVRKKYGQGSVTVIASDFVFSNRSLYNKTSRNAVVAAQLLNAAGVKPGAVVVFDESLNMTGSPKVVGILLDSLLRPMTIQSLLLLMLFAWGGSSRFGTILPPTLPPRHNVTSHTNALGNLYWRTGNGVAVIKAYFEQLMAELKLGLRRGKSTRSLEMIAKKTGKDVADVQSLLDVAQEAADRNAVLRGDAASLIRRLSLIRDRKEPTSSNS